MIRALACVGGILLLATTAHAQYISFTGGDASLNLSIDPAEPEPHQEITLTLTSSALDLQRSDITWVVDGKTLSHGVGLSSVTLITGDLGSVTSISASAESIDGAIGSVDAEIRPTEIDLLWESDSYVPPTYEGRALAGSQATIHLYAMTRFVDRDSVSPSTIDYTWYRDNTLITSASGIGKSSVRLPGPAPFGATTYTVKATSFDKTLHGSASVTIRAHDPSLSLYENHPLFGILFHRAFQGTAQAPEAEVTVTAVPYFAHITSLKDPALEFSWVLNGNEIVLDPKEPESLTIDARNYEGTSKIEVSTLNLNDIAMRATGVWNILFGTSQSLLGNPFSTN